MDSTADSMRAKLSVGFAALWFLIVFVLCSFPGNQIPNFQFLNQISFDKMIHLGMFAIQMILILRSLYIYQIQLQKHILYIAELLICWGIVLEYMQTTFFINRFGEWIDVIANSTGVLLGAWAGKKLYPI